LQPIYTHILLAKFARTKSDTQEPKGKGKTSQIQINMARKKVNLAWIQNDAMRRATFKKRKKGLIKKASELSTLCGVDTCVVIYGPQDQKPEVWPSPKEAHQVLSQFKNMPQLDQCKKMVDQEGFLRMHVTKAHERLCKVDRENKDLETKLLMHEVITGQRGLSDIVTIEDMTGLACNVEMRLKAVQERLHQLRLGMTYNIGGETMIQAAPHDVVPMALAASAPPSEEKLPVDADVRSWFNDADGLGFGCTEDMTTLMMPLCVESASAWDNHFAVN
jgi:SRF-type transcription factor (DNA-binding and dimerisation domain)